MAPSTSRDASFLHTTFHQHSKPRRLESLLATALPLLRGDYTSVDEKLPALLSLLHSSGAGECWHKHGNFVEHLYGTFRMLKLWGCPDPVTRCGLFHSTYSNAYVQLALFDHTAAGRALLAAHLGPAAERLVHIFCTVPRQKLVFGRILKCYDSVGQIVEHLADSDVSLRNARDGIVGGGEAWREKLNSILPDGRVRVENIKTGEEFVVSRRIAALLLLFTIADFADELFSFQDELYENVDGKLEFSGDNATALWPGVGKPGLWVSLISRMAAIYNLIVREEEIFIEERRKAGGISIDEERDEDIELVVPSILDGCTKIVDADEQVLARDMYWQAVCGNASEKNGCGGDGLDRTRELLVKSLEKNPFLGDPYLVLAQVYLSKGQFEAAETSAEKGLELLLEWGTPWDKRVSWEGWVAWGRVLLMKAREKSWPKTSWGIRSLGLIRSP